MGGGRWGSFIPSIFFSPKKKIHTHTSLWHSFWPANINGQKKILVAIPITSTEHMKARHMPTDSAYLQDFMAKMYPIPSATTGRLRPTIKITILLHHPRSFLMLALVEFRPWIRQSPKHFKTISSLSRPLVSLRRAAAVIIIKTYHQFFSHSGGRVPIKVKKVCSIWIMSRGSR